LLQSGLDLLGCDAEYQEQRDVAPTAGNFGDYELLEEIGRGGQGVVYRARQKKLNRTVALKIIGLGHWTTGAHLKRFRLEAEAAAGLDHPGIVPVYEIGEREHSCYFSMKFIEGGQLDELVRLRPLSLLDSVQLIAKLARTVHYAHEHSVLHRDIKPANVLVDANGEPHLTDFGLARLIEKESNITRTLQIMGTPSYIAPEQAAGDVTKVSAATDVYGVGAVFYQLLTGQPPFAGGTTYETIRLVLESEPRRPRLWNPKIDSELETICLKCLEKDPQRRYPTALALAEDLERWMRHEPIRARPSSIFFRARKWAQRNPATAVLAPLAILLAIALTTTWWNSARQQTRANGIAVLPFENLSPGKENAFLADGIQNDILTKLAKIGDLKVISRTSVMSYRGQRDMRQIGHALNVSHAIEGSVRRVGDRIHLDTELIDTRTDKQIWAEEYDRDFADIFAIQSEIAERIANQLRAKLSPEEKVAIAERPTADPMAYAYFARAREIDLSIDWQGMERSLNQKIELLEKAIHRDPNFALAYCELSKAHIDIRHVTEDDKEFEPARIAAEAALRLRPGWGEAHLALAEYYFEVAAATGSNDYNQTRDELSIVRRKLPNNAEAILIEAMIDRHENRWDAALANMKKASELDPRNGDVGFRLASVYLETRRYSELEQFLTRSDANDKVDEPVTPYFRVVMKLAQGDPAAAQSLLAQVPLEYSPGPWIWNTRFNAALYLRDYDGANRIVAATPAKFANYAFNDEPADWAYGQVAHARGDKQKALAAFAAAREKVEALARNQRKDGWYFAKIAKCDAGLGRKEDALDEARHAIEITPTAKDAVNGPLCVTALALVYAWTGERDRALEQLEKVATIPGGTDAVLTYGDLRFNPCWDTLRGDKRFDKVLAAAKAASR
jgi:serine/threonine protein kinase/tetratricopeptide (TPR) repeat protein